jgi:hypothetical protein
MDDNYKLGISQNLINSFANTTTVQQITQTVLLENKMKCKQCLIIL